ncbi:ATP-dependent RNA helicase dbp4 [Erysiphe necator]|nr:ATP-dependent RNA helicase dbp4 [Erysiphe necator]
MPSATTEHKPKSTIQHVKNARSQKRKRELEKHEDLTRAVEELDIQSSNFNEFSDLPLCQATAAGLEASHFKKLTDIQSKAIPIALKGKDILGSARTGSGKTLAFLIPVLDNLFRLRWTELDGLGALIISPTRELAIQIFDVLRKIGRHHSFSAGLVIGGRSLREERERLGRMNILVCTPGRMLQHMDQTAVFDVGNLQMLVLDEADRIMDMGFQQSVDAILEHLPKQRQTLLFSATQTKKVSDLARLSLHDPEYVAVHEDASSATPAALRQFYVVTPLPEKLNTLYSFIRSNLKSKIIVFLSSGKQVRFVYESFRLLQPGIPLLHLHGRQKQTARLDITSKFSVSKNSCIFATDVVARGLDFPAVDWVIQLDCPEDAETYIHRVGRTARYELDGKAALFLDPSEIDGMLKRLEHKKVPIQQTKPKEKKKQSIESQLQKFCFQNPELKYLGQKAFSSYVKSIYLQKDKEVFKLDEYDLKGFASSLGLPGAPKIKFQKGDDARKIKNTPRLMPLSDDDDEDEDEEVKATRKSKTKEVRTKYDRMFERRNQDVLSSHYSKIIAEDHTVPNQYEDAEEDNEFLTVKRVIPVDDENKNDDVSQMIPDLKPKIIIGIGKEQITIDSKRKEKLLKSKKKLLKFKEKGTKLVYDDDGNPHQIYELEDEDAFHKKGAPELQRAKFLEEEASRIKVADVDDKILVKKKKKEKREKLKANRQLAENSEALKNLPILTHGEATDSENEDPLAFLASLPQNVDEVEERPSKRPKKQSKNSSNDEENNRVNDDNTQVNDNQESLENLEKIAAKLLK